MKDDINRRIAKRVKELRATRDISLTGLSVKSGVSRSMISLIERGETSPTAAVLEKLAAGLDTSLAGLAAGHRAVAHAIGQEWVSACHDVSEGGYLVSVAEMCIASGFGAKLGAEDDPAAYFAEGNGRYVVETDYGARAALERYAQPAGLRVRELGRTSADGTLQISRLTPQRSESFELHAGVDELTKAWRGTLDW